MYLVGLTGGIASGKSTVSLMLRQLDCEIIDADKIAREGKLIYAVVIFDFSCCLKTHLESLIQSLKSTSFC
jgi:dephospho-CoA kinase